MKYIIIITALLLSVLNISAQPPSTGKPPVRPVYTILETHPEFPGGHEALLDFIKANLHYPAAEAKKHIEGIVHLSYIINEDGSTSDITVLGKPDKGFAKEGIRLVKAMPKYKPAEDNGKPVKSITTLSIKFELPHRPE